MRASVRCQGGGEIYTAKRSKALDLLRRVENHERVCDGERPSVWWARVEFQIAQRRAADGKAAPP